MRSFNMGEVYEIGKEESKLGGERDVPQSEGELS